MKMDKDMKDLLCVASALDRCLAKGWVAGGRCRMTTLGKEKAVKLVSANHIPPKEVIRPCLAAINDEDECEVDPELCVLIGYECGIDMDVMRKHLGID